MKQTLYNSFITAAAFGVIVLPANLNFDANVYSLDLTSNVSFNPAYFSVADDLILDKDIVISSQSINLLPSPTPTPTPTPKPSYKTQVNTQSPASMTAAYKVSVPEEKQYFEADFTEFGQAYGVDPGILKSIAKCESNFNPGVVSSNGLYGGLYQYMSSTWASTRNQMGADPDPQLRFNPKEAIRTTAFKIAHGGIGAWPHCSKVALGY